MIKIIEYYLIFVLVVVIISVVAILLTRISYKYFPKSKLSNFLRNHIVSDVDMEDYD